MKSTSSNNDMKVYFLKSTDHPRSNFDNLIIPASEELHMLRYKYDLKPTSTNEERVNQKRIEMLILMIKKHYGNNAHIGMYEGKKVVFHGGVLKTCNTRPHQSYCD